jgi:uncharacterized protein (DUF608 family)
MADSGHRTYDGTYTGERLNYTAFPLGGIGAGMVCLSGTGGLTHVSIRGIAEVFNEPYLTAAVCIKGDANQAKVLEGPVPTWKPTFPRGAGHMGSGNGAPTRSYGLPRFAEAEFEARFPFGHVRLSDPGFGLEAEICGWSPFVPGDEDASSLPVAALEYSFKNTAGKPIAAVFSFHAANLLSPNDLMLLIRNPAAVPFRVDRMKNGLILRLAGSQEDPWRERSFAAAVDDPETRCDYRWFRGDSPMDPFVMVWRHISEGAMPQNEPVSDGDRPSWGGSIYVPFTLGAGERRTIPLRLAWYVPGTNLREGEDPKPCEGNECDCRDATTEERHRAWYTGAFSGVEQVAAHWRDHYDTLRSRSLAFSECFYDTSLPPEIVESIAANLGILKSPTILRQPDGRLWMWEGCFDEAGCCPGSCTHVWNYAQAIPHLFPKLERTLRKTEYQESQDEKGHQQYRVNLPIRDTVHNFHAASDGQLGGIMKVFRDWRISGDSDWLRVLWPKVRRSLDFCIETWDPRRFGVLEEPHHNTYDIEFWGPDSMTSSCYLGALKAADMMGQFLGDDASLYRELYAKGRAYVESELWNGEYFVQKARWKGLRAEFPPRIPTLWSSGVKSPEALGLMEREGPNYQYGEGCLSDGVVGAWLAEVCGVGEVLDRDKVEKHLLAVYRHNFRKDLSQCANPSRPSYAFGHEGGLLLCTWPNGGEPTLPFFYGFEVWTGIEYQVASHLAMFGHTDKAREIVRTVRARYDGRVRNPFDEIECGHWYARALASYALLQGLTGARYDAVEKTLYLAPAVEGDFKSFLSTATGYGTVGVRDGVPFIDVAQGSIEVARVVCGSDVYPIEQ